MGQYQQWLQYRHNERHLKAQLEELAEELAQLRQREQELRQAQQAMLTPAEGNNSSLPLWSLPPLSHNTILQALTVMLNSVKGSNGHTLFPVTADRTNNTTARTNQTQQEQPADSSATISQALYSQSHLPNNMASYAHGGEAGQEAFQPLLDRNNALPPIPYSDPMMLPEDMGAFLDEHTETEPRVSLPWWLRNAGVLNPNGPVDQESARTNRLVQRWIERWGRHPIQSSQPGQPGQPAQSGQAGQIGQPPENGGKASS